MPSGLQVFDASGNVALDISDNTSKYFGTISIPAGNGSSNQSGSVSNGGFALGTPWWFVTLPPATFQSGQVEVSVSGTTLSWVASPDNLACYIHYGVI